MLKISINFALKFTSWHLAVEVIVMLLLAQLLKKFHPYDLLSQRLFVFMVNEERPPVNAHGDIFSAARGHIFGLTIPLLPYFMYARSEGSGKNVHTVKLV